ncbi:hypothetical protein H4219_005799 [Mycoemilia scoparia]|uniref:RING-type E3 ubiquitin transferase n=1 Tax=Mycoemilia scoparia TaxID=417184 RepID=A0A9W7ZT15_9FUNG|nr:hypothetical protein H4219_005799 [Mycoemilia scoparia]
MDAMIDSTSGPEYSTPANNSNGKLYIALDSTPSFLKSVNYVVSFLQLSNPHYNIDIHAEGIHWVDTGIITLYEGQPTRAMFEQSKSVFQQVYKKKLGSSPRYTDVNHGCEFQVFVKLKPKVPHGHGYHTIDKNGRAKTPTLDIGYGRSKRGAYSHLSMPWGSSILYSPNCKTLFTVPQPLAGLKISRFFDKAITLAEISSMIVVLQILLFIRQFRYSQTPSRASKVSYYTVAAHFRVEYIFVASVLRLALPLYAFACPKNIFFIEPSPYIWILCAWVCLQIIILISQDIFGPRYFVPQRYIPPRYNYHQAIHIVDEESPASPHDSLENPRTEVHGDPDVAQDTALNVPHQGHTGYPPHNDYDITTPLKPLKYAGTRDCAICIQSIDIKNSPSTLSNLKYMVTPCHHLFHTECLEEWMDIKLECPICRSILPPI